MVGHGSPGCRSSMTGQSFPPATADSTLEKKKSFMANITEQQLETGASLVDKKLGDFQWDFSSQTGHTNCAPDRRFMDLLGCSSPGKIIGGTWSFQESKWHINELELLAVKLALQAFQNFTSHLNKIYIFERNGGNQESENDYTLKRDLALILISEQIMITVEYLPNTLNKVADLESFFFFWTWNDRSFAISAIN